MTSKSRFFYGYVIVIISFMVMMVILGLQTSFGIFFKPIIETLGWSRTATYGAFSLSQIVGGISCIVIGGLNDRFGPRVSVTLCGILSVLGYFLMSQMQAVWQLYLYYGILIGAGIGVFVPILSTVAKWFFHRRSMMSGIAFAGTGFGMLIFPPLINWLFSAYDWHLTFVVLALITLAGSILSALFLKRDPSKVGQVAYGQSNAGTKNINAGNKSYTLREAMLTRQFWLFCIALLGYGFCFFAMDVHIAPYATDVGISSAGSATVLSILGGATIVGQIGFLVGIICIVAATFILIVFNQLGAFYLSAILLGLAFGNCSTQESPIVAWLFGLASHGIILGICAFSFTIGAAIGPLVFGYIFDMTGKYQYAFWITAVLAIATVILTVSVKQIASETTSSTI